jgi:HTH-type transcriptional regulator, transcriptional repressor of NAD biosynthesis genes
VLISYSRPELPGCEPERREKWLAARFPETRRLVVPNPDLASHREGGEPIEMPANDADGAAHHRFVAHLCRCVIGAEIDAVFTSEDYGDGFAASLEAGQREHNVNAPSVTHVCVDRARGTVPISASAIRADVHAHRHWLSPEVYASFVRRVCILGGESSGKSTLAKQLAMSLDTIQIAEYGRLLWEETAGALVFDDMLHIAECQIALEESAAGGARELLICDTSPLTTMLYSQHLFGRVDPALERIATSRRYDLTVLCAPDFPFVQDGTRQNDGFRRFQHQWYLDRLKARGDRWVLVAGSIEERVRTVREYLHPADAWTLHRRD